MSLGKYTELSTLKRHRDHVRLNRLEKENRALRREVQSLRDRIEKHRRGHVMISHNFERLRVLMEQVG